MSPRPYSTAISPFTGLFHFPHLLEVSCVSLTNQSKRDLPGLLWKIFCFLTKGIYTSAGFLKSAVLMLVLEAEAGTEVVAHETASTMEDPRMKTVSKMLTKCWHRWVTQPALSCHNYTVIYWKIGIFLIQCSQIFWCLPHLNQYNCFPIRT